MTSTADGDAREKGSSVMGPGSFDSLLPPAMAARAEELGVKKAGMDPVNMFVLAILAGAFIAMGGVFATTVSAGGISIAASDAGIALTTSLPFGITRLLAGLAFSVGLILVVVGGAELFTGNTLITMAFASHRITLGSLLRNWVVVYVGNLAGAVLTAFLVFLGRQYTFGSGSIGLVALNIGEAKTSLGFIQAVALGALCNALVCMAVWMCYSARSTADKILAIIPPIACFVAAGFEHSIANMYFIPFALFIKQGGGDQFLETIGRTAADFPHLTWTNFLAANLVPVTIGNVIGGALMVGLVYWFVYSRKRA